MKVRESLAAVGMSVGVLAGCTAESGEAPSTNYEVSVEDVRDEAEQAYSEAKAFWAEKGVIDNPPALVMPENETITCGTETVTPAKGNEVIGAACYVTNTLYVWPKPLAEQTQDAIEKGAALKPVIALIISHDYGHFVQKAMNVLDHPELRPIIEPQADCLAGFVMRTAHPNAPASVEIYYRGIEEHLGRPDTRHGSAEQRLASFMLGYVPQAGLNCDNVVPLR